MQTVSSVEEVMIFSSSWMFIVSFIVPVILSYDEMTVYGNCSRTRPPEHLVVLGKPFQREPFNCTLYGTERCKGSLPPHLEGTISATPPTSLSVNGTLIADPNQNSSPQIIIEWETPESDAGRGRIHGFRLEIRIHDMTDNSSKLVCRIFDFSHSLFNPSGAKLIFQKKLVGFVGGSHLLYQLHLSSLPHHSPDVRLTRFFTLQPVQKGIDIPARNWIPFISYDEIQFTAPANIEARFSLAPLRYGFRQYTVMLVSKNDSLNAVETCIVSTDSGYFCQEREFDPPSQNETTFLASFRDIAAGEYVIHIQPVDPYSQDDLRCVCYSAIYHGVRQCQPCLDTPSTMFTVGCSAQISRPMTTTTVTTSVTTTNTSMITTATTSMMTTTTTPMITTTTMSKNTTTTTPTMTATTRHMTTTTTMSMMNTTTTPKITTFSRLMSTTTTPIITKITTPNMTTTTMPPITTTTMPVPNAATQLTPLQRTPRLILLHLLSVFAL
ncbi:uncharacterized protein LOC124125945 [Haliotis rufescens]|uniref:uncharacterized protein LOC124125945 n=1 Tax=Haliotis rufescens TaxID=6454 RepID=UPI00201EE33A|nr:uncharacterized protein LOC124125945 [Haliotis rufescens]